MHPVLLRRSIAWLHAPTQPRSLGVVLCPALGREARWSYRSLRRLACHLAEAGIPALRFDYPGTGDAPDLLDGEDALAVWRASVDEAIGCLHTHAGVEHVALAGLRFGALLAADVAAGRADIAGVALLAPMLTGRTCARELRLASFGTEDDPGPAGGIEVDGMVIANDTLAALALMDLRALTSPPAPNILMLDESGRAAALATQYQSAGASVTVAPFPGYGMMMRVATSNEVPNEALACVAGWFGHLPHTSLRPLPSFTGESRGEGRENPETTKGARFSSLRPDPLPPAGEGEGPWLEQPGYRERAIQFGPECRLAGILCEPEGPSPAHAVLIANTGGDGRAGIARFGVRLAHALAQAGTASLRFDFAGLGDSTLPGDTDGHPYLTCRTTDIHAALDVLQARNYQRMGGIGLCTGAYHLLHAAFDEKRFEDLALVNLVTYKWQPGDMLDVPQRPRGQMASPRPEAPALSIDGDPIRGAMTTLLTRGTRLLLMLGAGDPGSMALEANFGPGGRTLAALPGVTIRFETAIDHTLSRRAMQDRVADSASAFFSPSGRGPG